MIGCVFWITLVANRRTWRRDFKRIPRINVFPGPEASFSDFLFFSINQICNPSNLIDDSCWFWIQSHLVISFSLFLHESFLQLLYLSLTKLHFFELWAFLLHFKRSLKFLLFNHIAVFMFLFLFLKTKIAKGPFTSGIRWILVVFIGRLVEKLRFLKWKFNLRHFGFFGTIFGNNIPFLVEIILNNLRICVVMWLWNGSSPE